MIRSKELLGKAAEAFAEGRDPFSDHWLAENQVTIDECLALSATVGLILKGFLNSSKDTQSVIFVSGGLADAGVKGETVEYVVARRRVIGDLRD